MNEGTLALSSTTVSGNAANGSGGGLFNLGVLHLNNATVSNNTADLNGGAADEGGGVFNTVSGAIDLANTIIAGNVDMGGAPQTAAER